MHIVTIDVRGLAYYIIMHLGSWSGKVKIQIEEKVICYQLELGKRNVPIDSYSFYMVYNWLPRHTTSTKDDSCIIVGRA